MTWLRGHPWPQSVSIKTLSTVAGAQLMQTTSVTVLGVTNTPSIQHQHSLAHRGWAMPRATRLYWSHSHQDRVK